MIILSTNGGPHSAMDWAKATAGHIVEIAATADDLSMNEGMEFQRRLIPMLHEHHWGIQEAERDHLLEDAAKRFSHPLTADRVPFSDDALAAPVDQIRGLLEGKRFAANFNEVHLRGLRDLLRRDFSSIIHVERSWHADRNPDFAPGLMFRELHHPRAKDEKRGQQKQAGTTTAMCGSFKAEAAQAIHNFTITTGNVFKIALIKVGPAGTYGASSTNYSNITGNSDEVGSGGGYTTGGFAWTAAQNITPLNTAGAAYWQFSVNPSWTSATFSTTAGMIYNSSQSNKSVSTHDFGGTQTVSAGTLTLVQPSNAASTSLLQIN